MKEMNRELLDRIDIEAHSSLNLKKINDNLYLSKKQIDILDKYDVEYLNRSIADLLFELEEILNDSYEELIDLEDVSREISEFNYYHNTKK